MKNFKTAVDGTGTTLVAGKINYLRTLLHGESLQEFDKLASHNTGTSNAHLKFIQEGLFVFFSRLTPFPSRSAQCALQCINLANSLSNTFLPVSRNSKSTSLFSLARAPPRRWPPKNSTRFSYTPSWTARENIPIYRDDILRWRATKLHTSCSKEWKSRKILRSWNNL